MSDMPGNQQTGHRNQAELASRRRALVQSIEQLRPEDGDFNERSREIILQINELDNEINGFKDSLSAFRDGEFATEGVAQVHASDSETDDEVEEQQTHTLFGRKNKRFDSISSSSTALIISEDEDDRDQRSSNAQMGSAPSDNPSVGMNNPPPSSLNTHKNIRDDAGSDDELEITAVASAPAVKSTGSYTSMQSGSGSQSQTSMSSSSPDVMMTRPRPVKRSYSSLFESSKGIPSMMSVGNGSAAKFTIGPSGQRKSNAESSFTSDDIIEEVEGSQINKYKVDYYERNYFPHIIPQVRQRARAVLQKLVGLHDASEKKIYDLRRQLNETNILIQAAREKINEESDSDARGREQNYLLNLARNVQLFQAQIAAEKPKLSEIKSKFQVFNSNIYPDFSSLTNYIDGLMLANRAGSRGQAPSVLSLMDQMAMRSTVSETDINKEIENLLDNINSDENIAPGDRTGTPEGLKVNLFEHQKLGLSWLLKMEKNPATKGGILADDMGLGKTIQMISLILSNPPPREPGQLVPPTLIITPVSLLQQWEREIKTKIKDESALRVRVQHSSADKKLLSFKEMCAYDVVITTYRVISGQYQEHFNVNTGEIDPDSAPDSRRSRLYHNSGFFTGKWYRIILDEAHSIKNRRSLANTACSALDSEFRWCLSGTPMQNGVDELQSLIKFLQIKPYNDYGKFASSISVGLRSETQSQDCMQRLRALLKAILLRRTKNSKLDGKPILRLPPKTVEKNYHSFEGDELAYYKGIEGQITNKFNKYFNENTVGQNYSNILTMLLRLRQACCHPMLIARSAQIAQARGAMNKEEKALPALRELSREAVERVLHESDNFTCPICMDAIDKSNTVLFLPCAHHICSECALQYFEEQGNNDGEGAIKTVACPKCGKKIKEYNKVSYDTFNAVWVNDMTDAEVLKNWAERRKLERIEHRNRKQIIAARRQRRLDEMMFENDFKSMTVENGDEVVFGNRTFTASRASPVILNEGTSVKFEETDSKDAGGLNYGNGSYTITNDEATKSELYENQGMQHKPVISKVYDDVRNGDSSSFLSVDNLSVVNDSGDVDAIKSEEVIVAAKVESHYDSANSFGTMDDKSNIISNTKVEDISCSSSKQFTSAVNKSAPPAAYNEACEELGMATLFKRGWVSSTKVESFMKLLLMITKEYPGEKVIVFSQFTTMLTMLEVPLLAENIDYLRYDGAMNASDRNQAVLDFFDTTTSVMLISLKAGNVGLTLTCASHIIIMDPFWNPFVEEQAMDRAHRIGQIRPVHVYRVLIRETVEDRIMDLQEKKRQLIEAALDEKGFQSLSRLTTDDLRYLFTGHRGGR